VPVENLLPEDLFGLGRAHEWGRSRMSPTCSGGSTTLIASRMESDRFPTSAEAPLHGSDAVEPGELQASSGAPPCSGE
jgi:hypothetical protein